MSNKSPQNSLKRSDSGSPSVHRHNRKADLAHKVSRRRSHSGSRDRQRDIPACAKLFVSNIDGRIAQEQVKEDLRREYEYFGRIKEIIVKTRFNSSNTYAFVEYEELSDATKALEETKGRKFKGQHLNVQYARGETRRTNQRREPRRYERQGRYDRSSYERPPRDEYRHHRRSRSRSKDLHKHHHKHRRDMYSPDYQNQRHSRRRSRSYSNDSRDYRRKRRTQSPKYYEGRRRDYDIRRSPRSPRSPEYYPRHHRH